MNICVEESCTEFARTKGLCSKHYYVHRRLERAKVVCRISGCSSPSNTGGMCPTHYYRHKSDIAVSEGRLCSVEGCGRGIQSKGLCHSHYVVQNKGGTVRPAVCVFPSCSEPSRAAGSKCPTHYDNCVVKECVNETRQGARMCDMHTLRLSRGGDIGDSSRKRARVGTRSEWHMNANGYIQKVVRVDGKNIAFLQHRIVMSESLGRALYEHENVHHINGDRSDNRLENLELWSTSQPPGQRVEDKVKWALEILSLYGPDSEMNS